MCKHFNIRFVAIHTSLGAFSVIFQLSRIQNDEIKGLLCPSFDSRECVCAQLWRLLLGNWSWFLSLNHYCIEIYLRECNFQKDCLITILFFCKMVTITFQTHNLVHNAQITKPKVSFIEFSRFFACTVHALPETPKDLFHSAVMWCRQLCRLKSLSFVKR